MIEIKQTETFKRWAAKLRDDKAKAIIASRLNRLAYGLPGDVQPVGEGISELRIHYGPGYRVYFKQKGTALVVLLCGGIKTSQEKDIKQAKRLALQWCGDD